MSRRSYTPDFLIIGAMKCGTTTLYRALAQAPHVFLPENKEPDILHRGRSAAECTRLYKRHFRGAPEDAVLGEASTMYTMTPWFSEVAQRAHDVCGADLQLIYLMRDPMERTLSHLRHDYATGRLQHADFDTAVFAEPRYLAVSDYAAQLTPWIETFGVAQIHFISFADLRDRQSEAVANTLRFLGARPPEHLLDVRANANDSLHMSYNNPLARAAANPLYKRWLREAIPSALRTAIKSTTLLRRQPFDVRLSEPTLRRLRSHFTDMQARLFDLTGFEVSPTKRTGP